MVNKMKDYLPEIEMDKMKTLLDVEERYETGKITLEEAREIMRTKVGKIRPYHIAYMEQTLKDGAEDECVRGYAQGERATGGLHGHEPTRVTSRPSAYTLL